MAARLEIQMASDASDVVGDFKAASASVETFGRSTDEAADMAKRASRDMSGVADSADDMAGKTGKATGALGALAGGMEAVGLGGFAAGLQATAIATDFASGAGDALNLVLQSQILVSAKAKAAALASAVATTAQSAAAKAAAVTQWALNAAMAASPVLLVVLAVAALVAVVVLAWKRSETFRRVTTAAFEAVKNAASAAFEWVKKNWPLLLAIITGPIGLAVLAVVKNWDRITEGARTVKTKVGEFFDGIKTKVSNIFADIGTAADGVKDTLMAPFKAVLDVVGDIIDAIKKIKLPSVDLNPFGRTAAPGRGPVIPSSSSSSGAASGITYVEINVNGALDPDAVARQIKRLLRGQGVLVGERA